jgi:AhpD family alkylhydroperoxidase
MFAPIAVEVSVGARFGPKMNGKKVITSGLTPPAKPSVIGRWIRISTNGLLIPLNGSLRICDNLSLVVTTLFQDNSTKPMYNQQNLSKLKTMNELAPEVMKAFWAFDKLAVAEGAIPVKYKELIAVAVALTTQCPYCISIHSDNARKAGASPTELAEAAMVAASLRAGAAVTHATHALLE